VKLPRDIDGRKLAIALRVLGYDITRQRGSHIRVTTQRDGENHEVIPCHSPIKAGTLSSILKRKRQSKYRVGNYGCLAAQAAGVISAMR
jgi:predicted RNA binding protein YcfA (HicA-like mRNA interferase family)